MTTMTKMTLEEVDIKSPSWSILSQLELNSKLNSKLNLKSKNSNRNLNSLISDSKSESESKLELKFKSNKKEKLQQDDSQDQRVLSLSSSKQISNKFVCPLDNQQFELNLLSSTKKMTSEKAKKLNLKTKINSNNLVVVNNHQHHPPPLINRKLLPLNKLIELKTSLIYVLIFIYYLNSNFSCLEAFQQPLIRSEFDKQLLKKPLNGPNQLTSLSQTSQRSSSNNQAETSQRVSLSSTQNSPNSLNSFNSQPETSSLSESQLEASTNNASNNQSNSANSGFQCPEQFGYYTDTRDCTKYYVCVFGEVLHESCTGGLRFSRELQTCDWPRNVDCPQLKEQPPATTTLPTTTTTTSSSTTTSASSSSSTTSSTINRQLDSLASNSLSSSNRQQNAKESSENISDDSQRANNPLKGASLVFADEGSDPQQPSFDEAVSPVITSDGTIHLHDGSGGTFSLTPNHNARQQPNESGVDVFVKPLGGGGSSSSVSSQTNNNRRPQATNSNGLSLSSQQRTTQSSMKLQAATLPVRSTQSIATSNTFRPPLIPSTISTLATDASDSSNSDDDSNNSNSNSSLESDSGDDSLSSSNDQNAPNNDENNNNNNKFLNNNAGDSSDMMSNNNGDESESDSDATRQPISQPQQFGQPSSYIPPVMAPNPSISSSQLRHSSQIISNNPALTTTTTTTMTTQSLPSSNLQSTSARQSSQLLSINNRQIEPGRQSFKPVLLGASSFNNQFNGGLGTNNVGSSTRLLNNRLQMEDLSQANVNKARLSNLGNNAAGSESVEDDSSEQEQPQLVSNRPTFSSSMIQSQLQSQQHLRINSNQTLSNQQRQQQQQMAAAAAVQAAALQNNRQSRMSSSFQQANMPPPQQLFLNNNNQQQQQQQQQQNANLQSLSNNVNFNDSSKLIRLQASQFEPLQPQTPPADLTQPSSNLFLANNGLANNRFNSQQARSQNVLFSQQPFGLIQNDQNVNNNRDRLTNQELGVSGNNFQNAASSLLQQPRRPRPPKRQQIPSGQVNSGREGANLRQQQQQQLRSNLNLNRNNQNHFSDDSATSTTTQSSLAGSSPFLPSRNTFPMEDRAVSRPIVAPTTVNFQQDLTIDQPTTFATPRRFNNNNNNNDEQRQGQNQRTVTESQMQSMQQKPTSSVSSQNPTTQSIGFSPSTTTTGLNQEPDPQAVANRYLNSAIDALEAGQPFGTVDYDFDILNDNSTDRRTPSTGFNQANSSSTAFNGRNFNNNNNNNNNNNADQSNDGAELENINLTNGQPIGQPARPLAASVSNQQRGRQLPPASLNQNLPARSSNNLQLSSTPTPPTINQSAASQSTTKKPRPTNRKINVSHEQALANNRASIEPAKRPEAVFNTPTALQTATKCDARQCRLPDCKCGDTLTPGGLKAEQIPQIVLLTFDDAVNDLNWEIYEEIFTGRTNPNGCPILATFYVSHEWTDYGQVQTLYSRGHEMASHSVTHSFGEKFSKNQWFKEINGQREILNMYGGVKMNDVRGMRAPFLQIGGNKMFEMLYDANFTYDSSMPIFENSPPLWPYTLDYQLSHECMITPCPTKSFPGVWEVGMTMWVDLRGGRCSMGDACSNPNDEDGVYEMLMKNFNRHYKSNRAPFGLFYHSAWFNTVHHRRGFIRFMGTVNSLPDVYFTTNWQMLQWMRKPTPLQEIQNFEPWQCPAKNDRPPPCFHPSVCNVKSEHGKYQNINLPKQQQQQQQQSALRNLILIALIIILII